MRQYTPFEFFNTRTHRFLNIKSLFTLAVFMGLILPGLSQAWAAAPVVLTPFGQSPDAMMVKVVLKKVGVNGRLDKMLTKVGLKDEKALIVVVGGSSKGMGAAGINKDEEIVRVKELIVAAREKGSKVLVMHIGGKGRRGKLTDQFISEAIPLADKIIVVEGGDYDGLISNIAKDKGIEIKTAPNVRSCTDPLTAVLAEWNLL